MARHFKDERKAGVNSDTPSENNDAKSVSMGDNSCSQQSTGSTDSVKNTLAAAEKPPEENNSSNEDKGDNVCSQQSPGNCNVSNSK